MPCGPWCAASLDKRKPTLQYKIILTGATGYVGEGVLLECLAHPAIEQVLLVTRKPYDGQHPKIRQCVVPDFLELDGIAGELSGYDACFYCAGVSSVGLSEAEYSRITLDTTIQFASRLAGLNPQMTFCYVSGRNVSGRAEKSMWARVKWKTENALMELGFRQVYNFRAGFMKPTPGQQNVQTAYKLLAPLYPLWRVLFPAQVSTLRDVALAMIHSVLRGYPRPALEVTDIKSLARV